MLQLTVIAFSSDVYVTFFDSTPLRFVAIRLQLSSVDNENISRRLKSNCDYLTYVRFVTTNIVDIGECLFFITFTPMRVLKAIHLTNIRGVIQKFVA